MFQVHLPFTSVSSKGVPHFEASGENVQWLKFSSNPDLCELHKINPANIAIRIAELQDNIYNYDTSHLSIPFVKPMGRFSTFSTNITIYKTIGVSTFGAFNYKNSSSIVLYNSEASTHVPNLSFWFAPGLIAQTIRKESKQSDLFIHYAPMLIPFLHENNLLQHIISSSGIIRDSFKIDSFKGNSNNRKSYDYITLIHPFKFAIDHFHPLSTHPSIVNLSELKSPFGIALPIVSSKDQLNNLPVQVKSYFKLLLTECIFTLMENEPTCISLSKKAIGIISSMLEDVNRVDTFSRCFGWCLNSILDSVINDSATPYVGLRTAMKRISSINETLQKLTDRIEQLPEGDEGLEALNRRLDKQQLALSSS